MEGVLLVFIGALVVLVTVLAPGSERPAVAVYHLSAGVLVVMAAISQFTGARTAILPMRLCPAIFLTSAALFYLPSFLR